MARPAQSHDNTEVRQYLIDKLQMDYGFRYELPGWLDDASQALDASMEALAATLSRYPSTLS